MPFTSRNADRAEAPAYPAAASARFADSPVNGLLYVRGVIGEPQSPMHTRLYHHENPVSGAEARPLNAGGSAQVPEGELVVRLFEGAIGPTRLAQAQASAALDAAQRLRFGMDLAPLEPRPGGFAAVTGSVPLHRTAAPGDASGTVQCTLRAVRAPLD